MILHIRVYEDKTLKEFQNTRNKTVKSRYISIL